MPVDYDGEESRFRCTFLLVASAVVGQACVYANADADAGAGKQEGRKEGKIRRSYSSRGTSFLLLALVCRSFP
jgi:hypothetical protein